MSVPDPATTDWVPLWSLGSLGALPSDTVTPAATRIITSKFLAGDTQPAWRIMGDGKMEWGPGGTTAPDVNLYRSGADNLKTDDTFRVGLSLVVDNADVGSSLYFGSAIDTRLYRSAANALSTPGTFTTGGRIYSGAASTGGIYVNGSAATQFFGSYDATNVGIYNSQWFWLFRNDGYLSIGGDTWLYRYAASNLGILNTVRIADALVVANTTNNGPLYFGGPLDTYLTRRGAASLQTNGNFCASQQIYSMVDSALQTQIGNFRGVAEIAFGNTNDCAIYREATHWINHYSADGAWGGFKAAVFSVQSDRAKKSEIEEAVVPVDRMLKTGVYTYKRDKHPGRHLGLIADELPEELLDEGTTTEGETLQFVDLYKLTTAVLATVQHLDARLKVLEGAN